MTDKVSVAIIGYGLAGASFHAPLIKLVDGFAVTRIVTSASERQTQARQDFPEAEVLADVEMLFKRAGEIDLVVIACPNKYHAPYAKRALEANVAVVIDKPFAISSEQGKDLIETAYKNKALLTVFQNRRWDNDFLTIQKIIREKTIGSIYRLESRFEKWRPTPQLNKWKQKPGKEDGGGILFDLGSHLIDQARVLFGEPKSVYSEMHRRRPGVLVDDDSFVALDFENDVRVHLWMSEVVKEPAPRFRLVGSLGTYVKWGLDPQEAALRSGNYTKDLEWRKGPSDSYGTVYTADDHVAGRKYETVPGRYDYFYEQVFNAISKGVALPVDATDVLKGLEVIERARAATLVG
jgi:predicted dehydrogenase